MKLLIRNNNNNHPALKFCLFCRSLHHYTAQSHCSSFRFIVKLLEFVIQCFLHYRVSVFETAGFLEFLSPNLGDLPMEIKIIKHLI